MKLFYIDSLGNWSLSDVNGLFFFFDFNLDLFKKFLIFYKSNLRLNVSSQKNRSLLNYSTKKLYKQKGTGKARVGSASSPLRRKGARAFPSFSFENFNCKINRLLYKISLCMLFSQAFLQNSLYLIEDSFFVKPCSKFFFIKFSKNFFSLNFILISILMEKNFYLSCKNYFKFQIVNVLKIDPILLLKFSKILITRSSFLFFNKLLLW